MLQFTLTRTELEEKRLYATTHYGLTITGDSGDVVYMGVTVHYQYDAAVELLTVKIVHKPFYIPQSLVLSYIQKAFGE